MDKVDIKTLTKDELGSLLEMLGAERYRAQQIFRWLYKVEVKSFDEMTDIPINLRQRLKEKFHITHLALSDLKRSLLDGTTKFLLRLEDRNTIETVFLSEAKRNTVCLSSQVGCRYCCSFCASSAFGFVRNLSASEILDEVIFIKKELPFQPITNLVFMGIGEPLDNYNNILRAIKIFNDKDAFNIGSRKITISTCGIIPGIERLMKEGMQLELSVSLHSADDKVRSKLVPVNKIYPLKNLIRVCKDYIDKTNRVITFEYVMIKGINSSKEDALKLAALLKRVKCKVNTILYNSIRLAPISRGGTKMKDYEKPDASTVKMFVRVLKNNGINVYIRKSKGEDIDAGCGQLRISRL